MEEGDASKRPDTALQGWLYEVAARYAWVWKNPALADSLQRDAYSRNKSLHRPRVEVPYDPMGEPGGQAREIVKQIEEYHPRRGILSWADEIVSALAPTSSANQYEQALSELGTLLGFTSDRPEKACGKGPDNLWLTSRRLAYVFEVKSRKKPLTPLQKEEHGQLLTHVEWVKKNYPGMPLVRVFVHPNTLATDSHETGETRVMLLDRVARLAVDVRRMLEVLVASEVTGEALIRRCDQLLTEMHLTPEAIRDGCLASFSPAPK